jgi:putative FmdB family regulatory protein
MALYEYACASCGNRFEKRMPMADVVQFMTCPSCGKQAKKSLGAFAVVGRAESSAGDGPAPWEGGDDGDDDDDFGAGDFGGHGHSHGPGGHTH